MHTKISRKTLGISFVLVTFLIAMILPILGNSLVAATPASDGGATTYEGTWLSADKISLDFLTTNTPNVTFTYSPVVYKDSSSTYYDMFYAPAATGQCQDALMFNADPQGGNVPQYVLPDSATSKPCVYDYDPGNPVVMMNNQPFAAYLTAISPVTVNYNDDSTTDGLGGMYGGPPSAYGSTTSTTSNGNITLSSGLSGAGCSNTNTLQINNYQNYTDPKTAPTTATLTSYINPNPGPYNTQCTKVSSKSVPYFISLSLYANSINGDPFNQPASTSPPPSSSGPYCPISGGIGFLLCPIFSLGETAAQDLGDQIGRFLFVQTDGIFTGNNSQFSATFDNFRDFGLALLVIACLVMVISQAAGLEIFAAYTVRKALPRVVIAIIGIALAWPILLFVVTFFNDIGRWAYDIILGAASVNISGSTYQLNVIDVSTSVIAGGIGMVAVAAALSALGLFSLLIAAVLALLVGFVILSIRWLIIVVCILIAPLAIAAYVLPGTTKLWNFWRSTLLGALIMYPLIMAFLGAGYAMSTIALKYNAALAVIVFFAPYFMLPFAFRMSSGLMGAVAGGVQKAAGGSFAGLKKQRQTIRAQNWQKIKTGERYRGSNGLTKRFNKASLGFGTFMASDDKIGYLHNKDVRDSSRNKYNTMISGERAKRGNVLANQFNDDKLWAQVYNGDKDELTARFAADGDTGEGLKTRVARALATASDEGGYNFAAQTTAINQLAANGTGYKDMHDMSHAIARVSGGNRAVIDSLVGSTRNLSDRAGRHDLRANYQTNRSLAYTEANIDANGNQVDAVQTEEMNTRYAAATVEAALGADNTTLVRDKEQSVKNIAAALGAAAQNATTIAEAQRHIKGAVGPVEPVATDTLQGQAVAKLENLMGSSAWSPEVNVAAVAAAQRANPAPAVDKEAVATAQRANPAPVTTPPLAPATYQQAHDDVAARGRANYDPRADRPDEPPEDNPQP